ncbi:hypothetical protein Sa4125_19950 [Aureimonas sp. SA4125]|uniref:hypothetical protein n=1 Tax=Aureimonas sp. SA4125 TaxID=2826993 RepID=UPI001CC4DCD6|nr:hypothetical protein [Aureimonas sp. SA4125]BDA84453.1 hypothetical protein Sa4125_19950 [Aureimonas sp. SA4125]
MTAAIIGAVVGLAIGIADFVVLGAAARNSAGSRGGPLKIIRMMSLVVFPIVGWFVGPIVASSLSTSSLGG